MRASDFRKTAREKLAGKWGKAVLTVLAFSVIVFVLSFIQGLFSDNENIQSLLSLIVAIIEVPLSFGLIISLFKLYKGEETGAFDFLSLGFSNFGRAWGVTLRIFLKMLLPFILLIISVVLILGGVVGLNASNIISESNPADVASMISSSTNGAFSGLAIVGVILYIVSFVWIIIRSYTFQLAQIIAADNEDVSTKEAVEQSAKLMSGNRWKLFCLQFSFIGWAILAVFTLGIGYLWLAPYIQFAMFAFYKALAGDNDPVESTGTVNDSNDVDNPIDSNDEN